MTKLGDSSKYNLLRSCVKINPNNLYSIDLIIDAVKNNNYNIYPSTSFADVDSSEGIKYYLQKLISDEMLEIDRGLSEVCLEKSILKENGKNILI